MQERAVVRFIERAGSELQNRLCGIFLARDKAVAVEFEKQDHAAGSKLRG